MRLMTRWERPEPIGGSSAGRTRGSGPRGRWFDPIPPSMDVIWTHLPGEQLPELRHHTLRSVECSDDLDYWRALVTAWQMPTAIINVEHDVELTDELVDELAACRHPLCTHAYYVWPASGTGESGPQPAHINDGDWLCEGGEWATFSGIGFCKIEPAARRLPTFDQIGWKWLELKVNAAAHTPWHVHWPAIEHRHK